MKILVTPTSFKPDDSSGAYLKLKAFAGELVFNKTGKPLAAPELAKMLAGCDGVIAGLDDYSGEVIRACAGDASGNAAGSAANYSSKNAAGKLKVISRYGSGYDNVDVNAARSCGVAVCITPGANSQAVADLAFGLMLSAARRIPALDRSTKDGEWRRSIGVELYGKTLGILGLGAVGKAVARRAGGFSMEVLAYDSVYDYSFIEDNGIRIVSFDELIAKSDFISLHLPLNNETRNIMNRVALGSAKRGVIIINTARGGLMDMGAAYELLSSGHIGGLGLDAYDEEPPAYSPLFGLDNVVLTPHTGSHTAESAARLADMSVQNLIDVLSGRPCGYVVK